MGADGALHGTYTYPGQHGQWQATPTQPRPSSKSQWPPWWLWLLLAMTAAALVVGLAGIARASRRS